MYLISTLWWPCYLRLPVSDLPARPCFPTTPLRNAPLAATFLCMISSGLWMMGQPFRCIGTCTPSDPKQYVRLNYSVISHSQNRQVPDLPVSAADSPSIPFATADLPNGIQFAIISRWTLPIPHADWHQLCASGRQMSGLPV